MTVGDASDSALLRFVETFGSAAIIRQNFPKIAEIPFNSKNKYAVSVHKMEDPSTLIVIIKGMACCIYL